MKPSEKIDGLMEALWRKTGRHGNPEDFRATAITIYLDEQAKKSPTPQHLTGEE